jgi:hypothetical protein
MKPASENAFLGLTILVRDVVAKYATGVLQCSCVLERDCQDACMLGTRGDSGFKRLTEETWWRELLVAKYATSVHSSGDLRIRGHDSRISDRVLCGSWSSTFHAEASGRVRRASCTRRASIDYVEVQCRPPKRGYCHM